MWKLWYKISADGGNTWTVQHLFHSEAEDEIKAGYIVRCIGENVYTR